MQFQVQGHPEEAKHERRSGRVARVSSVAALALLAGIAAACNSAASPGGSTGTTAPASFNTLIAEGQAAQNAGDASQAETFYKQALAKEPNNATALYDLGDLQQIDLNDPIDAEKNYQKALLVDPNFENALFNLAILVTKSDPTEAENYYRQIIKIDPKGSASSHLNLGYIEISLGQQAAGEAEIREAAALDPAFDNRLPTTTTSTVSAKTTGASGATKP